MAPKSLCCLPVFFSTFPVILNLNCVILNEVKDLGSHLSSALSTEILRCAQNDSEPGSSGLHLPTARRDNLSRLRPVDNGESGIDPAICQSVPP